MDEDDKVAASEQLSLLASGCAVVAITFLCFGMEIRLFGDHGFSPGGLLLGLAIGLYGLSMWWASPFADPLFGEEGVHPNATGPFVFVLGVLVLSTALCF